MSRLTWTILIVCCLASGCSDVAKLGPGGGTRPTESLASQQARAYPETITGRFVSLVDFEDAPGGERGFEQVEHFSVRADHGESQLKFVVNVTRTGAGAMEVTLPKGSELVFTIPGYRDFSGYSLLSLAIFSEALRDDLCVSVTTDTASWTSHPTLVRPGWNNALMDIQRLESLPGFDITSVTSIGLFFAQAAGPVRFNLDDIMLVSNERDLLPVPKGMVLRKSGLNYTISLPHRNEPIELSQGNDGLWRFAWEQPTIQIASPGESLPPVGERLELMGPRRVGRVEVLETNPVRVRLANTWFFPGRAGEWVSFGVRRIRWEHTFYSDGRWVTHVELNNSGGKEIGAVRMWLDEMASWSAGVVSRDFVIRDFAGPLGRWSFLLVPNTLKKPTLQKNYLSSGAIMPIIADRSGFAPGDLDRDRFDESQGCYFLASVNSHCRFKIVPPPEGLLHPVFRVSGQWNGPVSVNCQGLAIHDVVSSDDGSVLFMLPVWIRRPMSVEVTSEPSTAD